MTRVLLTGASGFGGHHCLEHILTVTDWDVIATGSFRHRGTCDRIEQVLNGRRDWRSRVTVLTHDLTAPFSPQEEAVTAGRDGLDYIIAMASMSHVDTSITDPAGFTENNVAVILSTLELARRLLPAAVVVISTDEVYGPVPELAVAHREWSTVLPSNPYSASKAAQEAIAIAYWRTYGVPVIITNTMNLIGERQHPEKFVPKTLRAVLTGTEAVIHGGPGHVGSRHYLHARNMADAVTWLLQHTVPAVYSARGAARPDRYNIASPDRIDNLTMARMIADAAGKDLRWRFEDFHLTRPGHDAHYGLDPGKIHALGWKAPVPFAESLERTVRWTIANPSWLLDA